jgi:hypothetical protein
MIFTGKGRRVVFSGLLAAPLGLAGLWAVCAPARVDPRGWQLADFVNHLHQSGLRLKVVPSRRDGQWCDNLYLTQDPALTWQSFQLKPRTADSRAQWRGSVWVGHFSPGDADWLLFDWPQHACRIGDFFLFGDDRLIARIQQTFLSGGRAPCTGLP